MSETNRFVNVQVLVEGSTESIFIRELLNPYLAKSNINLQPQSISGTGGNVKFRIAINTISKSLKHWKDSYVSLFFDYYGTKEWPGLDKAKNETDPAKIANIINEETKKAVQEQLEDRYKPDIRFIPFVTIHEFEAMLFSSPEILAEELSINIKKIQEIENLKLV